MRQCSDKGMGECALVLLQQNANGQLCAGLLSFFSSLGGSGITELLLSLKQLYANSLC